VYAYAMPLVIQGAAVLPGPVATAPAAGPTQPPPPTSGTPASDVDLATCRGVVTASDEALVLNGEDVFLLGVNTHYLMDEEFPEAQSDAALSDLEAAGVNAIRVWFFHDEDPERFERLLDRAGEHGLAVVVTLADNVFKGRDWFFGEEDEEDYRPHVARTVARFRDRPEIAVWELINEPNCGNGGYDDDCLKRIRDWLVMAARIVREADPCRPISTGMIGAGNFDSEHANYRLTHSKDEIDLASVHRATDQEWDTASDLAGGEPIFFGEVYDRAYDAGCNPLGPSALNDRAERVKADVRAAVADGVDGYFLWDYAAGTIRRTNGDAKHYCSEFGYAGDDPVWSKLRGSGIPRAQFDFPDPRE
jgi:beta-galactosidase/beta-glucuronidase